MIFHTSILELCAKFATSLMLNITVKLLITPVENDDLKLND